MPYRVGGLALSRQRVELLKMGHRFILMILSAADFPLTSSLEFLYDGRVDIPK